jgi:hypothetical protein
MPSSNYAATKGDKIAWVQKGCDEVKRIIISTLIAISTTSAHADTYNYVCKEHGRSVPLRVDDTRNILEWRGTIYKIKETEDCGKFGWRAEKDGASFDFCTATQGYADFEQSGTRIQCNLKR